MELTQIIGYLLLAGVIFFITYWLFIRLAWARMNPVDQAEMVRRISLKRDKTSLQAKLQRTINQYKGAEGSGGVIIYGWLFAVAAAFAVGIAGGLNPLIALLIALPASLLILLLVAKWVAKTRKKRFEQQLMTAMSLIAAQLESGAGLKRSFERVVEVVDNPLQEEMIIVLTQVESGSTIVEAISAMRDRYPSSAMKLFVAALEADADSPGGKLAPVLRSIADGLEKQFELRSEAEAEIAQSRYQFYGIVGGLAVISFLMYAMGGEATKASFHSPIGILIMVPILANAVFGVWRINRLFAEASGVSHD